MGADPSTQNCSSGFPSSPSSSSSHRWHVFLSFRGVDTRKTFTGNLYAALAHGGIRTFMDDPQLRSGEELSSTLIEAIHNSEMSIVVFSENYASSRWCLDELVQIMECNRTKGQVVLPVFYNVEPSVVRHQSGSFGNAFEKHKARHMDKIGIWRSALTGAAGVSGFDLENHANGHEANLIHEIVRTVQQSLRFLNPLEVAEHLVGMDARINEIKPKLSIDSNDVRFIGICGMGGIGKTTLAKSINNQFFKDFEARCFLKDVREVSQQPNGLDRLQQQLIDDVLKTNNNTLHVRNVDEGASMIRQTFCRKRVLIVVDDVDHTRQLKFLAGHQSWFGGGSRIIITTRNSRFLTQFKIDEQYMMEKLSEDESLELFSYHAFESTTPFKDFMDLSKSVVRYTNGLPLALEVLGSYLVRRTEAEWIGTLEKLNEIPDNEIQEKLRISYDTLDDKQKEIFLDIAFFFIGMDKEEVIDILDSCGFFPDINIPILHERCLLKTDWENKLGMHDLIRQMGKEIVREESFKYPGKRSRLCCEEEVIDVLKNKGSESIEGITVELTPSMSMDFDAKIFESMTNLRLLQINNVRVTGNFEISFAELRWLGWQGCPLTCLPSSFNPSKLISLDLQCSNLSTLWEGTKDLQSLKILNVGHSERLTTTPDFGGVKKLKKLMFQKCTSLSHMHPSIGQLTSMVHLDFSGCWDLEYLPDSIGNLDRLNNLGLEGCKKFKSLPNSICNLASLKNLDLSQCENLEYLPDSIGNLNRLNFLGLENCKKLKSLPKSICNLTSLEYLGLSVCKNLEYLPDSIGNLDKLNCLELYGCTKLKSLPNSICNLTSLENLNLGWCENLEYLPDSFGNLNRLNSLEWEDCKKLKSLPNSICNLTSVQILCLQGCCDLKFLPDQLRNMEGLVKLSVSYTAVEQLPDSLKYLNQLTTLEIGNVPEWIGTCLSLESLYIWGKNIHSLPSTLTQLSKLHDLSLVDCINLQSLPPHLPSSLHHLKLRSCTSLLELPKLSHLKDLFVLDVSYCFMLRVVPSLPPNLKRLQSWGCSSLRKLPKLSHLKDLDNVNVVDCISLRVVPSLPPNLKTLHASGCTSLRKLPKLPNMLRDLLFPDCNKLEFTLEKSFIEEAHHSFQARLPDREVPNWFSYQNMGSSVSFDLPQNLECNFRGLCTWVVYVSTSTSLSLNMQAVISNKTESAEFNFGGYVDPMTFEEQSWAASTGIPMAMKSGDRIEVSFAAYTYSKGDWVGDVITRCGVHLLYNHPNISNSDYCKRGRNDDFAETTTHSKRLKDC